MAERGEFTKRAFLNKKLDLSQAEAVDDLIHAKTSNFAIQSAKNLSGVLATKINEIKGEIFETTSRIVAGIDFPEDVAEPEYSYLIERFTKSLEQIKKILSEQFSISEDEIGMDTSFTEDIGADSLDLVELIMALEQEFDVEIDDDEVEGIKTVGDAVRYIKDKA